MVFIFAMTGNIQIATCCIGEGFKKMKKHFRWHIPHFFPLEMRIPNDPVPSAEIQAAHWHRRRPSAGQTISLHASFIRQRF